MPPEAYTLAYGLAGTLVAALVGFVAKYLHDRLTARQKGRLERVGLQLRNLYGPLYATDQAAAIAYEAFRQRVRPGRHFFDPADPPSADELAVWRRWMTAVFMPINLRLETIIVENADLLIEDAMPQCLIDLCAHVAAYKAVMSAWQGGDFREHKSIVNYPGESLREYARGSFLRLQQEQARLLGILGQKSA